MNPPEKMQEIPIGLAHMGFLSAVNKVNRGKSESILGEEKEHLQSSGLH
jgi:hypothetical protein